MIFFPQNNCIYLYYVLFQDSAKWVSAKRDWTSQSVDWWKVGLNTITTKKTTQQHKQPRNKTITYYKLNQMKLKPGLEAVYTVLELT